MALHLDRIGSFIPNYIDDSVGWAYDPGFGGYEFRDVFFDRGFDYGGGLASLNIGPDLELIKFGPSLSNVEDTFKYDVFSGLESFIPNYIDDSFEWAYDPGFDYVGGLASLQNDRIESSTESEDTESEDAGAGFFSWLGSPFSLNVASDPTAVVTQPAGTGAVETTADVFTRAPTEIPTDLSGAQALILANELGLGTGDVARGVSDAQVTQAAQDALTGNLTKADISVLSQAGLGPETGFNIHNPTQSVAQMQAAQNAGDFASQYLVPFLISSIPGAGLAMTGANLAQGLSSGQITGAQALSRVAPIALQAMFPGSAEAAIVGGGISGLLQGQTPGQVAVNAGINIISQQTGLPPGTIAAIANGDFGSAAASTVMGALRTEIAQQTGLPSAVINAGLDITGAGRTLSSAISGGINDALGSSNQNNLGALSSFINASLSGTGTAQTGTAGSGTMVGGALPVGGFLPNLGGTVSSGLDRVSGSSDTTGATTGAATAATTTTTATAPTRKKRQPVVSTTDFTGGATGSEEGDLAASAGYGGADDYEGYYASDDVTTDTSVDDLFDIVDGADQATQNTITELADTDAIDQAYQDPTRSLDTPTNEAAYNQLVEAFLQPTQVSALESAVPQTLEELEAWLGKGSIEATPIQMAGLPALAPVAAEALTAGAARYLAPAAMRFAANNPQFAATLAQSSNPIAQALAASLGITAAALPGSTTKSVTDTGDEYERLLARYPASGAAPAASQPLISDLAGQAQQNVYAEQTANELLQQLGGSAIQDLAQSTQGTVYDVAGDPYADLGETATETTQQTDQGQVDLDKILESLLPTDQALAPDSGDIDALLNEIVGGAQQPTGTEVTERERTAFEEANMLPEGGTLETTLPDTQTEAQPTTQPDVIDQLVKAGLTEDTDVLLPTTQETTADTQPVTQPTEDVVTTTPVEAPAPGAGQTTEVVTETPTDGVVPTETPSGGPVTTETPTDLPSDVTGGVTETSTEETTEDTTVTQPSTTGEATTLPAQGVVQDLIDAGLTQEGGGVTLEDVVSTPTTPTTPTDTTETATPTTPTGPAGDAVVTQTPTSSEQLTAQDVTSIVNQAIAANPSLSAQDVQNAINDAISNLPAGITAADVNTAINSALSNLPASVTPEQMQSAIASATKEIQGSQLTSSDVSTIVNNAISANPGLSVTDVQSVVNNAISNIPAGLTAADVNTAISEALNNLPAFVTPEQMQGAVSAAIQQIQGSQLTSSDVSNIVSDALAANPGLNIQDVENVVNTAVSNIPAGLTSTDVNTAISNALSNLPASVTPEQMQGAVNAAIQEIQKSQVTTQDVSNIVNQAIAANPGLSTQDVERVVNNAISNIPAGLTKDDVNAAINSALGGLPDSVTPEEMQGAVNNAIQEIQKSQITTQDVSNIVNEAISSNPGLSTEDVERVVNTALSNLPAGLTASDVNTAISDALGALPDFVTPDQMQGAVNIAIEEIKEGQLTANQVNSIVNAALTSNPGLKIEDVQEVVSNAIDNLPAGITAADVNTAVTTAISNLPASVTPAQLTAAVNNAVSAAVSTAVQTSQAQSTNQMQQLMAMLGSRGGQRQAAQPTVYTPVLANFKDTFDVDDLFMGGNDRTTVEDLLSIIGAGRRS